MTTEANVERPARSDQRQRKLWRRRKRDRPGEILQAAFEEFAQKGFVAVRMSDIARRAGVTKGTLYLYFGSKLDLFNSIAIAGRSKSEGAV